MLRNLVVRRRWAQDRVERWGKVLEWNSQGQKLRLRSLSRCPSSPSAVQVTAMGRGGRECGQRPGGVPVDCLHKGDLLNLKGLDFVERTILNKDFHHPPELRAEIYGTSELSQKTQNLLFELR